jgi:predicted dehydrogenase
MVVNSSTFNFKEVVDKYLQDYNADVIEAMTESADEVSKEAVKRLRANARAEFGNGKYAKGWARRLEKGRLRVSATVYGKSGTYQIAHLLEHGHATRNGTGRVYPDTPAHPHIAEVNDWAQDEVVNRMVDKLERGIE